MPRQDGVHHLRHHGFVVTYNARKQWRGALQLADQIIAEFILHGPARDAVLGKCAVAKSAESTGQIPGGFSQLPTPFARLYQKDAERRRSAGDHYQRCQVPKMSGDLGISMRRRARYAGSGISSTAADSPLSTLRARAASNSFSHCATTMVATPLPTRLVNARISDMKRSTPSSRVRPATGTVPMAERVAARVMNPPPVTAAAPFELSIRMPKSAASCSTVRCTLVACAMNSAAMLR